jgi:phosphate-selective porin
MEDRMIGQATIKRRDVLLVASSMLATAISATAAAAQTQVPAGPKSDTQASPPAATPDEPNESPSRGRRFS